MQDFRSMSTGNPRIFGGERRMRPHPNQALKCPRCDSLNTKFCYYNNYNLSQPRHFCKSCRRYWTKGGILRNVPVGGGCRKTKRSKQKNSVESQRERKSNSHSSSESSSLTAATTTTAATEASASSMNVHESNLFSSQNPSPKANFETPSTLMENFEQQPENSTMFTESGSFANLMTASNPAIMSFNLSDLSPFRLQQQQQQQSSQKMIDEMKIQELTTGFLDQTVPVDLPLPNRNLTAIDWQSNGDHGLFDLTNSVDQSYYWNQSHWGENDHSLYLP